MGDDAKASPPGTRSAGRSRQWLGAVPAARIWAACQSLPLVGTLGAPSGSGESRTAPGRPGAEPLRRGAGRGATDGAGGSPQVNGDLTGVPGAASTGVASFTWTFASSGLWYVCSMANATPYNANSVKSPTEQYKVSYRG